MADGAASRRDILEPLVLVAVSLVAAVCVVLLKPVHPFIDGNATGIVGIVFLLLTWAAIQRRKEHPADYGLSLGQWPRELLDVAILAMVIFPAFFIGFRLWWRVRTGIDWDLPWPLWQLAATHILVVALPEEFLYRGFVQQRLGRVLRGRIRILGTQVGWAVVITAALFAAGHFLTDMRVDRLATFFPALVFGWLKERRGSLVGPVLFHASANFFSDILAEGYFG
ncbi:MAG: CPBP family intramembrane metalloprotease [Deltaproteobacteria bacterium]|nr:CPBP family intramembrane metalloprotease [Deltaproteobacteria bacterium]